MWLKSNSSVDLWLNGGSSGLPGERWWYRQGQVSEGVTPNGRAIMFADIGKLILSSKSHCFYLERRTPEL